MTTNCHRIRIQEGNKLKHLLIIKTNFPAKSELR